MGRDRAQLLSIRVDLRKQQLDLLQRGELLKSFPVSTSKYGAGEVRNSYKTPRGGHVIRAMIGAGQPLGAVFRGRRPTGEIYSAELARAHSDRDWILTRILWLSGTQVGKNRLGNVDTMRRYIYIHGAPDSGQPGVPGSIGCIRMVNRDVVELFDRVTPGTVVHIVEE
ncbi:MAG TPA: L,D-transpeptidase [Gammaproteobacteria bacterium]|nr:L,D-transpeptidase [Gammaproteobacteria bacterium]